MITKLDIQMFHDESWKPVYFGVKRSKIKVTSHMKSLQAWDFALSVNAGFFCLHWRLFLAADRTPAEICRKHSGCISIKKCPEFYASNGLCREHVVVAQWYKKYLAIANRSCIGGSGKKKAPQ